MRQHKDCLVLNCDYTPLCTVSWQKAIVLWYRNTNGYKNNIEVVSYYDSDNIQSVSESLSVPSVIRLTRYYNFFNKNIKFCRKNLFIRDDYTCQYCGCKKDIRQLTYDHIIPKSKWPANSKRKPTGWLNITTACVACNLKKGDKTPLQAKMPLLKEPYAPSKNEKYLPITQYLLTIEEVPQEWKQYLSHYIK
jgi:5-methylcytosine-specific restriction endonuclease McrA